MIVTKKMKNTLVYLGVEVDFVNSSKKAGIKVIKLFYFAVYFYDVVNVSSIQKSKMKFVW